MDIVGPLSDSLPPALEPILQALAQEAAHVEIHGVRRTAIDDLAHLGLLGTALEPAARQRELAERLAMADASTWFCWTQHQTPLRVLEGSAPGIVSPASASLRSRHLEQMSTGRQLAAVAFAHVRRPGPPDPVARRVEGGWLLDGTLDWVTSWDIADVVMVMAQGDGGDSDVLVGAFLPAGRGPATDGLVPGRPLELLAMSGTHTRPVHLESVFVPDADVVLVDRQAWLDADTSTSANATPGAFGVIRGAVAELDDVAEQRGDAAMRQTADRLAERCLTLRAKAYADIDAGAPVADRVAMRVEVLDLVMTAATSVVIARSGASMARGSSAERRLREAAFLQIQAQTAVTRAAALDLIVSRGL